jgi:hypothetical protein
MSSEQLLDRARELAEEAERLASERFAWPKRRLDR